ncbi:MAG: hypothetical protein MZW92_04210 [Comamonadaceae bacterium]|nr:hypothetical protein [Comamonadaceae bacterium]
MQPRRRGRPGPERERRSPARCARWWPADRRQLARQPTARATTCSVRLAPEPRRAAPTWRACRCVVAPAADGSARIVRLSQVADDARRPPARTRSTGATCNARGRHRRQRARPQRRRGVRRHPAACSTAIGLAAGLPLQLRRLDQEHAGVVRLRRVGALALAVVFIYMILASQFQQLPAAAGADEPRCR